MQLTKSKGGSLFRKIAMGSWWTAGDPSVYGIVEIDMAPALEWMQNKEQQSGVRLSISHLMGKAMAILLQERPEINGIIKRRRIYLRKHVDLFFQVNVPGKGADAISKATLSGVTVRKAETLTTLEIAQVLNDKALSLKTTGEGELSKSVKQVTWVPWWAMKFVLNFFSSLNYDFNFPMQLLGLTKDPFGSVMITNIGALGGELALAPLVPYTRVPILIAMGEIQPRPWVVDQEVVVRPVMKVGVTFDHRFMDGTHAAAMSRKLKECFQNPEIYF
jgi:pyruvate dehydrogenase E2 component (dihydrolipoamide acetyltransferase)